MSATKPIIIIKKLYQDAKPNAEPEVQASPEGKIPETALQPKPEGEATIPAVAPNEE